MAIALAFAGCVVQPGSSPSGTSPNSTARPTNEALVSDDELREFAGQNESFVVLLMGLDGNDVRLVTSVDAISQLRSQGGHRLALGLVSEVALVDLSGDAVGPSIEGFLVAADPIYVYYENEALTQIHAFNVSSGQSQRVWAAPSPCKIVPPGSISRGSNTLAIVLFCDEARSDGWNTRLTLVDLSSAEHSSHALAREPEFRGNDRIVFTSPQGIDEFVLDESQSHNLVQGSTQMSLRRPAGPGTLALSYIRTDFGGTSPGAQGANRTFIADNLIHGNQTLLRTSAFSIRDYDILNATHVVVALQRNTGPSGASR